MAIQTQNKNYFKVNLENTEIINGELVISIDVYNNIESRNNEKNKLENINQFIQNVENKLAQEYSNLISTINTNQIDVKNESELQSFFNNNIMFKQQAEEFNKQQTEFVSFKQYFFKKSENPLTLIYLDVWKSLGLKEEWLENPIIKVGTQKINVGFYNQQPLTVTYLYDKLKSCVTNFEDC